MRVIAAGTVVAAFTLLIGSMTPSSAQAPAPAGGQLEPFAQSLGDSIVKLQMIPIPGGTLKVGGKPVTVKPFWISRTETPWEAFDVFTASGEPSPPYDQTEFPPDAIARPSKSYILPDMGWGHNGYPVINISFTTAQMFARWVAASTKKKFRLPTEAEWELACRAGNMAPWKIDKAEVEKTAWHWLNTSRITHPVGKKQPNKYGLFDMFGNVGEWSTDMAGKPVLCGGTFKDSPTNMLPTVRRRFEPRWQETDPQFPKSRWWLSDAPFCGVRLVCEP